MVDAKSEFIDYYDNSWRSMTDDFEMLIADKNGGFVHMSPEVCIFAKGVDSTMDYRWPELDIEYDNVDAYYIHLMAGSVEAAKELARRMPLKKYIVFHRGHRDENDRPHKISMVKFIR